MPESQRVARQVACCWLHHAPFVSPRNKIRGCTSLSCLGLSIIFSFVAHRIEEEFSSVNSVCQTMRWLSLGSLRITAFDNLNVFLAYSSLRLWKKNVRAVCSIW